MTKTVELVIQTLAAKICNYIWNGFQKSDFIEFAMILLVNTSII